MSLLSTIGTEFEGVSATASEIQDRIPREVKSGIYEVTRDASVESSMVKVGRTSKFFLGSKKLSGCRSLRNSDTTTTGFEIVTRPLEREDMRKVSAGVLEAMKRAGEVFSPRSSIHFHVGFPKGYSFLKPTLSMMLAMEPLFFRIAGMGNKYRGAINKSAYARPLEMPPVIPIEDGTFAALSPIKGLEADDQFSFWKNYGILHGGNTNRYHPARYFAANLYSIKLRGTLEFRYFNYCPSVKHVWGVMALCQSVAEMACKLPMWKTNALRKLSSLGDYPDSEYHKLLDTFYGLSVDYDGEFNMEEGDLRSVHEMIDETPKFSLKREQILTHLDRYSMGTGEVLLFGLERVKSQEVVSSGALTIHNFSQRETKFYQEEDN